MDDQEELEYILNIQNNKNVNESIFALADKHAGLCYNICLKCANNNSLTTSVDELFSCRFFVVYKAALKYKLSKGCQFNTLLGNEMRFFCLNERRRLKVDQASLVDLEEKEFKKIVEEKENIDKDISCNDIQKFILDSLSNIHDKRIPKIFNMRYANKNMTFSQIGKEIGLTHQRVHQLHQRGIQFLQNKLSKEKSKI